MTSRFFRSRHTPLSLSPAGCTPPPTPTGLAISNITTTGFRASWNAVPGAVEYYLDPNIGPTQVVSAPATHFDFTGLTPDTEYSLQILVTDDCSFSPYSTPPVTARTKALPGVVWALGGQSNDPTAANRRVITIAEGNGRVVAGALTRVLVSTDSGQSFTNYTNSPASSFVPFITFGNGRFVGLSNNNSGMYYSVDGVTWTQSNMTNDVWTVVAWVPWANEFLACRYDGWTAWSPDGITWTFNVNVGSSGVDNIFVAPTHVVLTCGSNTARRTSVKGTWTNATGLTSTRWSFCWAGAYGWRGVDTQFSEQGLYASTDGNAFASLGNLLPSSAAWRGIAYDPVSNTLMIWRSGAVFTSTDGGATWSTVATGVMPVDGGNSYFAYGTLWAPTAGRFFIGANDLTISPP